MFHLLEKLCGTDLTDERTRSAYGKAASTVGIGANVLLFVLKLAVGLLSRSVAITADAVNNLTDASSSVVSLLGFKLADKPADEDHPYGHGRFEYLSGLMVAVMILVIGVELMKSSVEKILHPEAVEASVLTLVVLIGAMAMKTWMALFNRRVGEKIDSKTLIATAEDSRNDVLATGAVLISTGIGMVTGWHIDGWMGALVAAFILVSGFGLVRDTMDPVLGQAPTAEQVASIRAKLESYPGVLGTHDLMVHDYGPGRQFASVHLEMDAQMDPMESHDLIDNIERDFQREMKLNLVVHFDPVATDDPRVAELRTLLSDTAMAMDPAMTIHDVRIVPGATHTNVVFDCVVPYACQVEPGVIRRTMTEAVQKNNPSYFCVMTLEHSFVHTQG